MTDEELRRAYNDAGGGDAGLRAVAETAARAERERAVSETIRASKLSVAYENARRRYEAAEAERDAAVARATVAEYDRDNVRKHLTHYRKVYDDTQRLIAAARSEHHQDLENALLRAERAEAEVSRLREAHESQERQLRALGGHNVVADAAREARKGDR